MTSLATNCPSCAGPVEFQSGASIVVVCPFCRSVVSRTDRGVEDLGKVAEVVESASPLKLGLKGKYKDKRFELTGRAQIKHELGGVWDEWYATFSNGWVGWLAEAQGRFYMTFYQPTPDGVVLPDFAGLQLGQNVTEIPSPAPLMVQEKGRATYNAADGEIPYKLVPGEQFEYADLAGKGGAFATIDYSIEPPWVFLGSQVSLDDIGLGSATSAVREARRVDAAAVSCPNCAGPLALEAPDKTERVTCPNCDSLLDVNQGRLSYLRALVKPVNAPSFVAPIGAEGTLPDGNKYKIIGAMVRSVTFDGVKYFWHEYLLYNFAVGFRWLVHSDNHWNFVEPINPAEVEMTHIGMGGTATYGGTTYKIFQDAEATVEYVAGEFYWRVEQNERVRAADFVAAPKMLSREATGSEINWSLGTYLTNDEVEKIFGVSDLPRPWGVAPNQPFTGQFYYTWGSLPLILLVTIAVLMIPLLGFQSTVLNQSLTLPPMASASAPQAIFTQPFEIKANRNVQIRAAAPVSNSWVDLDVDLINDQSQEVESVNIPIEFYAGVDGGESWSEGGTSQYAVISSLPAGKYTLRIEGSWEKWQVQQPVEVKVEQNVSRFTNFACAFLLLLIVPVIGLIRKVSFESSRWRDSMFTLSGGDDDDDE
jgi:hypothetical protein